MTTRITIELTDQEVKDLRLGVGIAGVNLYGKVSAALPPEPLRLEIELPDPPSSDLRLTWEWWSQWGPHQPRQETSEYSALVLNTVRDAIRTKAAQK